MDNNKLTLDAVYESICVIADNFESHKDAITGFDDSPIGYKYLYAINYVDTDILNGGIYQLHSNSTWHLILDAIEGSKEFGFVDFSNLLKEILYYYHRSGRSKMKKRIPDGFFNSFPKTWNKSLEELESEYDDFFKLGNLDSISDMLQKALDTHPSLLE